MAYSCSFPSPDSNVFGYRAGAVSPPNINERDKTPEQLGIDMAALLVELSSNGKRSVPSGIWTGVATKRGLINERDETNLFIFVNYMRHRICQHFAIAVGSGCYRPSPEALARFSNPAWHNLPPLPLVRDLKKMLAGTRLPSPVCNPAPVLTLVSAPKPPLTRPKCGHSTCTRGEPCKLKSAVRVTGEDFFSSFSYD